MNTAKPFDLSKRSIWEAWQKVKANAGSHGVDKQSIDAFDSQLKDNLYKLWNRLSSGSYQPPAVRLVEIPKKGGGTRPLGIPTVADRVAQTMVKAKLEPALEKIFHPDSYGYRPGKSAHQALKVTKERCWKNDWVIDLDIKAFFDSVDHSLMMKALSVHTKCKWTLLYVERWLKVGYQDDKGNIIPRTRGTPQGGVISPLLANLFMHYAFDLWMERNSRFLNFARYADDIVIHCRTKIQAEKLLNAIQHRFKECGLELHPEKTKIVQCVDSRRKWVAQHKSFDFLGCTFRPRTARNKNGELFTGFLPAISTKARNQ